MDQNNSRRDFVKKIGITSVAAVAIPQIVSAAFAAHAIKPLKLSKDNIILFQGDSITDWRR
ncbi:MAG: twin-arginine translocation signal domain-containing protein, partial [Arachidicoccus sp.]|nr:twin-arginine translocation signal domain-containing protein [Arachidicoccus sp.]